MERTSVHKVVVSSVVFECELIPAVNERASLK